MVNDDGDPPSRLLDEDYDYNSDTPPPLLDEDDDDENEDCTCTLEGALAITRCLGIAD